MWDLLRPDWRPSDISCFKLGMRGNKNDKIGITKIGISRIPFCFYLFVMGLCFKPVYRKERKVFITLQIAYVACHFFFYLLCLLTPFTNCLKMDRTQAGIATWSSSTDLTEPTHCAVIKGGHFCDGSHQYLPAFPYLPLPLLLSLSFTMYGLNYKDFSQ